MLRVQPRYNHWIPRVIGAAAITLYPFVFILYDRNAAVTAGIVRHECVHVRQVRAMGWTHFYASYLWLWFIAFLKTWSYNKAYYAVKYEKEAYATESEVVLSDSERAEFYP